MVGDVKDVGPVTARRLREAGYVSVEALAVARPSGSTL
ncbi:MAG: helix-hairpin-helix domain-containing protein [Thermoproteota archaeon]